MAAHAGAAGRQGRKARTTVWTVADVTRDREKQENVFQELQHAIDYLDHAPAGFLSVDAAGNIVYLNATLANWLDQDLAEVGSGGLKLADVVTGEGASLLSLPPAPGEVTTEVLDLDFKTRCGRSVPVRLFHKVAFGADGTPGTSRTLVLNRARGREAGRDSAPPKCGSCASSTIRRWQLRPSTVRAASCARMRCSRGCSRAWLRKAANARSLLPSPNAIAAALEQAIAKASQGQGDIDPVDATLSDGAERSASFFVTAIDDDGERDSEAAIIYALDNTERRALESQIKQQQKMEIRRSARRRHRARLQQRAVRDHDGDRFPAERAQADRPVFLRHHADQAECQPRRGAGAAASGLLAPADPASAGARSRRGAVRCRHPAEAADRREGQTRTWCMAAIFGRSRPTCRNSSR